MFSQLSFKSIFKLLSLLQLSGAGHVMPVCYTQLSMLIKSLPLASSGVQEKKNIDGRNCTIFLELHR